MHLVIYLTFTYESGCGQNFKEFNLDRKIPP